MGKNISGLTARYGWGLPGRLKEGGGNDWEYKKGIVGVGKQGSEIRKGRGHREGYREGESREYGEERRRVCTLNHHSRVVSTDSQAVDVHRTNKGPHLASQVQSDGNIHPPQNHQHADGRAREDTKRVPVPHDEIEPKSDEMAKGGWPGAVRVHSYVESVATS